jgi:hypothetical protein
MRRRRRRIVGCGRRTRLVEGALVIRLSRRVGNVRPGVVEPLRRARRNALRRCHDLPLRLRRPGVLGLHAARGIVARQVRAVDGRPRADCGKCSAQSSARSGRRTPGADKSLRANVGSTNGRDGAPIKVERLLMIGSGHGSMVECPRALGSRSTIHDHQPARQWARAAWRKNWTDWHRPPRRMHADDRYWRPNAANIPSRRPSPTEGVVVP